VYESCLKVRNAGAKSLKFCTDTANLGPRFH
jgi:hypothetical protein